MALTVTPNSVRARRSVPLRTLNFFWFLGIFLTSAATLTLQISIIRLLSVAQWYHFAFMVVSMALLGYGATGLFSFSALVAYLASNYIPFDLARIAWDRWQIFYIFLYYLVFSLPFFSRGWPSLRPWPGGALFREKSILPI